MEETSTNLNPFTVTESSNTPGTQLHPKWNLTPNNYHEDFHKIFSESRDVHDLLVHAFQCELPDCQDSDCIKVKELYRSSIQSHDYGYPCSAVAYGCCDLCAKMWYFLKLHARNCKKEFCYVPRCSYLKDSMKLVQPMQRYYPQQAAATEMIRQRAAESVPDTMDGDQPMLAEHIRMEDQRQKLVYQASLQPFQTPIAGSYNHAGTQLNPYISNSRAKLIEKQKNLFRDSKKILSANRDIPDLLLHAFQCEISECHDPDCLKVKELYRNGIKSHGIQCTRYASGGCDPCSTMWCFLKLHARKCKKELCYVPHCGKFTYSSITGKKWQYAQNYPQRAAATEMTRKRAAAAVPDTIDKHQFNRFDQNPMKAQKISIGVGKGTGMGRVSEANSILSSDLGSSSDPSTPSLTTSTSLTETVNGSHQFKITGYSLLKGLGIGKHIASDTFNVGGYAWAIYFFPDGRSPEDNAAGHVSLYVALVSEGTDVRALFELKLLDQSGKEMHKVHGHFGGRTLENGPPTLKSRGSMWGYKHFLKRTTLETSDYLKDDCLSIHCRVGVVKSHTERSMIDSVSTLSSDIGQHFGELLESGMGTEEFSTESLHLGSVKENQRLEYTQQPLENSMSENSFQLCGDKELTYEPPSVSNESRDFTSAPAVPGTRLRKKKSNEEIDDWLRNMLDLLIHASQCRQSQCQYHNCRKVKGLFRHGLECETRASGGCILCKKMWYLLQIHAQNCKTKSECHVPRCRDLKDHLKRWLQKQSTRRRAAVIEMIRQQATEGVLDKMGHLSVAVEAPVMDTNEEDYYPADVVEKMGHLSITETTLETVDEQQQSVPEVVLDSMDEHQSVDDEWVCI